MRDHFSSILIEGVKGVKRCDRSSDSKKEDNLNEQTQGIPSISKKDDMDLIAENLSHLGTPLKSEGVPLCIKDLLVSHPAHLGTPLYIEFVFSFNERAAIMEFDGCMTHEQSENLALLETLIGFLNTYNLE
jgi:hypothetical protein